MANINNSGTVTDTFSRDGKTYTSPYAGLPGYQDAFNKYVNYLGSVHSDSDTLRSAIIKELDNTVTQFNGQFKNLVGREATPDETSKFFSEHGADTVQGGVRGEALRNDIVQYIGDNFQQAAQDTAQQKTQDLAGKYGSLADTYMEMGKKSLGNLSDSLKQFSTSLFEKLRPQLNLAAQAGGYDNSGGQTLQEQGALKDLGTQAEGVLGQAAYGVENNANAIRYGGQAAPVSMASEFAANQPYVLQNAGAGALNFGNNNYNSQQQYLQQLGLLDAQGRISNRTFENNQPSFGRTLSQSFANSFGNSAGDQATQYGKQGLAALFA